MSKVTCGFSGITEAVSGNSLSAYRTVGNVNGVMSATHGGKA